MRNLLLGSGGSGSRAAEGRALGLLGHHAQLFNAHGLDMTHDLHHDAVGNFFVGPQKETLVLP